MRELPVLLPGQRGAPDVVGAVPQASAGAEDGTPDKPRPPISGGVVAGDAPSILVRGLPEDEVVAQESSTMNHASDCAIHNGPAEKPGPCDCGANKTATIRKPKVMPGVTIHARMPTKTDAVQRLGLDGVSPAGGKPYRNIKIKPYTAFIIATNGDQHPISYRGGYKYQTDVDFTMPTGICPDSTISNGFLHLNVAGVLTIKAGYAWDGATGAIWTNTIKRGSLVHDALYQLMRAGKLHSHRRERVDILFRNICLADGMWRVRAWWVHRAVRRLAGAAADPKNKKKVMVAP